MALGALLAAGATPLAAQTTACAGFGSARHDVQRISEIAGLVPVSAGLARRGSGADATGACGASIWGPAADTTARPFRLLPLEASTFGNSGYATDRNNGAAWNGRGLNARIAGGVGLEYGPLSVALRPAIIWQQNADFDTKRVTNLRYYELVYPWHGHRIDYPQRFGESSFWTFDPGQSHVRLAGFGAALGASTENMWWGPALRNPILMSNTAAGIPHVFLGTDGAVATPIGRVQAEVIWSRLRESEWFDTISTNDERIFTGVVASWAPRWVAGLEVGGARVYYRTIPPGGLEFRDYIPFLEPVFKENLVDEENPTGDDRSDQLLSLFGRWVFPHSGLELYGEWAKNDHNNSLDDFVQEPEHATGWTWGLQKLFDPDGAADARVVRTWFEATHLDRAITRLDRRHGSFYTHGIAQGGYTHEGQLLGASVGPGGNAQALGADLIHTRGAFGFYVERLRRDSDEYYRTQKRWAGDPGNSGGNPNRECACSEWTQDVELTLGSRATLLMRDFELNAALAYSHRRHRNFLNRDESNVVVELGAAFRP